MCVVNNYTATTNPNKNSDSSAGYSVGDFWLNTSTGKMFQCRVNTTGAALWIGLNSVVNAKDYGAAGDGRHSTDGSISSGNNVLTSTALGFTSSDVGKSVCVDGAGASGAALVTTISSVSGSTATLAASASTTVSAALTTVYTDDTSAIQAAINSLSLSQGVDAPLISVGGVIFFPIGEYVISSSLTIKGNMWLIGSGNGTCLYANGALSNTRGAIEIANTGLGYGEDILLANMTLYTESGYGVTTNSSTQLTLGNCVFRDLLVSCQNTAFYFPGTLSGNIGAYCANCTFDNIKFYNNGAGLIRVLGNQVRITRCDSEESVRSGYTTSLYAIHCEYNFPWGASYEISDNIIEHSSGVQAIYLAGGPNHVLRNNWVESVAPASGDFAYTFANCTGLLIDKLDLDAGNNITASFTSTDAIIGRLDFQTNSVTPDQVLNWDSNSTIRIGNWISLYDPGYMDDEHVVIQSYKRNNTADGNLYSSTGITMPRTANLCQNGNFAAGMYGWSTSTSGGVTGTWSVAQNPKGGQVASLNITANPNTTQTLVGTLSTTVSIPPKYQGQSIPLYISFETSGPSGWYALLEDPAGGTAYNRSLGSKTIVRYSPPSGGLPSTVTFSWLVYYNGGSDPKTGTITIGDVQVAAGTRGNYVPDIAASRQWPSGAIQITGTAAPTSGTWPQGSIVWNDGASASGNIGWVCTSAGSPGTWKTFGTISA